MVNNEIMEDLANDVIKGVKHGRMYTGRSI